MSIRDTYVDMQHLIRLFDDERLERELAFAKGFGPTIAHNASLWLNLLELEARERDTRKKICAGLTRLSDETTKLAESVDSLITELRQNKSKGGLLQ